ncbi:unnamed protein product, partial [Closterium sp. NIES-54]
STPNAPGVGGSGASSGGKRPAQEGKKPPKPAKCGSDRPSSGNPLARTSSIAAEFGDLPAPKRTHYQYSELQLATENFNEANVLGQGGFGKVYYGVLPVHPAQVVAVKVLKQGGGEQGDEEFVTELELLSRLEHKHLVKLMGYCMRKDQRLLVYEFLPNGSLADHLHGKKVRQNGPLSWEKRLKIAVGSARGLRYLHSQRPQVLHRDVKSPNILITDSYVAKVADFGCAKLIKQTILVEDPNTGQMVETLGENVDVAMGTHGHMAPEILMTGEISAATDVYSFGVVMLELLSGRVPVFEDGTMLTHWATPFLKDKRWDELIDPSMLAGHTPEGGGGEGGVTGGTGAGASADADVALPRVAATSAFARCAELAESCIQFDPLMRPSMEDVAHTLQAIQLGTY